MTEIVLPVIQLFVSALLIVAIAVVVWLSILARLVEAIEDLNFT